MQRVYALHVPRLSDIRREQLGDAYEFKWMNDNNEICLRDDLDDSLIFFFLESLENASIEEKDISVLRIYLDRR